MTYGKILFVGKYKEQSISKFIFVEHALQLLAGFHNTISVIRIDHEDDALSILEIVSPQRSDLVLTTNVPHGKLNVLVFNGLNVEA